MSDSRSGGGKHAFFWLAMAILVGLVFSAGVMVGRGLGIDDCEKGVQALDSIDRRDEDKGSTDGGQLTFPEVLSKPDRPKPVITSRPDPVVKPVVPADAKSKPDGGSKSHEVVVQVKKDGGSPGSCLQVASFRETHQARRLVEKLAAAGYKDVRFVAGQVPNKGTYYRVRVGRFSSGAELEEVKAKLALNEGLRSLVMVCEE